MNKDVKNYIEKQKSPQMEILLRLRKIILETLPDCDEELAWGVAVFANEKFYLASLKNKVHFGFAINGLSEEEKAFFEGNGKTMRHIKILTLQDIDEKKLARLIKLVNEKAVCKPC